MAPDSSELPFSPDAVWIGSDHPFDLHESYLCFRSPTEWQLAHNPARSRIFITADSRYRLWMNGHFVARGPARSYPQTQSVDLLDVSEHVRAGRNAVCVHVYQPGYSHFSYVHRAATGVLLCLVSDGEKVLVSDGRWRVRLDPSFRSGVPRVSIYGSGIEERDLELTDDWLNPGYDDTGWQPARVFAPVGGSPWLDLRLRTVPLLNEREVLMELLQARSGPYPDAHQSDPHQAVREGWITAAPGPSGAGESDWYRPRLRDGEAGYWLWDLGRDYTFQCWTEIEGASGQELLSISYLEKMQDGEPVFSDPRTYCRVRLTDRFKLKPGAQIVETFALRGGRYLLLQLVGRTGPDFRFRPHARVAEYPLTITKPLPVSDPLLAAVIKLCETTTRACLQDGFVDSVWRESAQWLGDALPQGLIMSAMTDDTRPLKQVIEMAVQGAYPDGVLPGVLPGEVHAYVVLDYNFTWVELLLLYKRITDDRPFVIRLLPALVKMLDRFHEDRNAEGLIMSQAGRRLFLDWSPVSRAEPSAIYNLRYLLALQQAVQLAVEARIPEEVADPWRERAEQLQTAIRAAFWEDGRWYDDVDRTTFSQLAAALAILTHSTTSEEVEPVLEGIAARSLDGDDQPAPEKAVLASPFMHHYVFEALRMHDQDELVIEIIRRRWGRWVEAGYPTAWENWNVDFPDGSQCHAFSAHPRYHLAEIARKRGGRL